MSGCTVLYTLRADAPTVVHLGPTSADVDAASAAWAMGEPPIRGAVGLYLLASGALHLRVRVQPSDANLLPQAKLASATTGLLRWCPNKAGGFMSVGGYVWAITRPGVEVDLQLSRPLVDDGGGVVWRATLDTADARFVLPQPPPAQ